MTSHLDACTKMTIVKIRVIVDAGRKDVSLDEIKALATKKLPAGSFDAPQVEPHPIAAVLAELTKVIAKTPDLAGCRAVDAQFILDDSDALSLSLLGELARSAQRVALTQLCNEAIAAAYNDTQLDVPVARTNELTVPRIKPETLIARMRTRMKDQPGLTGCSVTTAVYSDRGNGNELELSLRVAHLGQKAMAIREANAVLFENYGDDVPFVPTAGKVQVVPIPTDWIVAELQRRIETEHDLDLGGCQITSMKYSNDAEVESALLFGRVALASQRETIVTLANDVIENKYGSEWPRANTNQLQVIASSPEVAAEFFNVGLGHFARQEFAAAEESFAQAILENPRRVENKYWLIAAQIGSGKTDQAYERLRPMTHGRRAGDSIYDSRYVGVLSSLERVQGPIRYKLRQLELRAFTEGLAPKVPLPAR